MSNLWPKKWSRSLKKFEQCLLKREFLKQYLTEKLNGYLYKVSLKGGGRLREVVARRELTVLKSHLLSSPAVFHVYISHIPVMEYSPFQVFNILVYQTSICFASSA